MDKTGHTLGINPDDPRFLWPNEVKPSPFPKPADWPVSILSYGGGDLARFPVRRRKKRLAKKVAKRGYFRHHNRMAQHLAWRESKQVEGQLAALVWVPPQPGTLGNFYGQSA